MAPALPAVSPEAWGASLTAEPPPLRRLDGGFVRHFAGTSPAMEQPPLDHHYVAVHLGGPKLVRRWGEGATLEADAALGSLTVVPLGAAFRWLTRGPIEFGHLYIAPRRLARTVRDVFDREPAEIALRPAIGWRDPLATSLLMTLLDPDLDLGPDGRLARDNWYEALLVRLVHAGSTLDVTTPRARNRLAPRTLARLKNHIADHLATPISLDDLAAVAGLSRFHLCRSFREATGLPPHAYVTRERLARARCLLRTTDLSIAQVAAACGFGSAGQFATAFRKALGSSPSAFRRGD